MWCIVKIQEGVLYHHSESHQTDTMLNVILTQSLSNQSCPQKWEDPLHGYEVNLGRQKMHDQNNIKEVVLSKVKGTAAHPFHDLRKGT